MAISDGCMGRILGYQQMQADHPKLSFPNKCRTICWRVIDWTMAFGSSSTYRSSARWFIPVMAVLLGHSSAMQVRGLGNFVTMSQRNRGQYDFMLGNGASQWQALVPFMRTSLLAILSPTIANLSALALASLPLLFCGMLLGGFAPINAFAMMVYAVLGCIASSVSALGITLVIIKYIHRLS